MSTGSLTSTGHATVLDSRIGSGERGNACLREQLEECMAMLAKPLLWLGQGKG